MADDFYDFDKEYSQIYSKKCECGELIEVSTQKDNNPEYYSEVHVKCKCGRPVGFSLPVNWWQTQWATQKVSALIVVS